MTSSKRFIHLEFTHMKSGVNINNQRKETNAFFSLLQEFMYLFIGCFRLNCTPKKKKPKTKTQKAKCSSSENHETFTRYIPNYVFLTII